MKFIVLPLPEGQKYAVARPNHMGNSHTQFGWISSESLGGDSVTDRRTEEAPSTVAFLEDIDSKVTILKTKTCVKIQGN